MAKVWPVEDEMSNNIENLNTCLKSNNHCVVMLIYHPSCGYCQDFLPTWNEMEKQFVMNEVPLDDNYIISKVHRDMLHKIELDEAYKQNIPGVPHVVMKHPIKNLEEYSGDRTLEDLVKWVTQHQKEKIKIHIKPKTLKQLKKMGFKLKTRTKRKNTKKDKKKKTTSKNKGPLKKNNKLKKKKPSKKSKK